MKQQEKRRGRPRGAKTERPPVVEHELTTCPRCSSTNRSAYFNHREHVIDGKRHVWRRTRCEDCGQLRDDKTIVESE